MINFSTITIAVESLLNTKLFGYTITRNEVRNEDPSVAAKNKGWIGVYRGKLDYKAYTTGGKPWLVDIDVVVEVQTASMGSGEDVENKLQAAEKEILDVLTADKQLGNTVIMTTGYTIEYFYNKDEEIYHHSAVITIHAQQRT